MVDITSTGGIRLNRLIRGKRPYLSARERDPAKIDRFMRLAAVAVAAADPDWSCSLDVAKRGRHTLEDVGAAFRITRERIRQITLSACNGMREECS